MRLHLCGIAGASLESCCRSSRNDTDLSTLEGTGGGHHWLHYSHERLTKQGGLLVRVPVMRLDGISFQPWAARLSLRMYGWGFSSLQETCGPAYLATLETSIQRMVEICPILASV